MTYVLYIIPVVLISFLSLLLCVLISKFIRLNSKYKSILLFLKKISHTLSSARYGNLYSNMDLNKNNPVTYEISKNINDLFESILDRDVMIKEYVEKEKEDTALKEDFIATLTHDLKVPIIAQDNTYNLLLDGKFGTLSDLQKEAVENLKISNIDLKFLVEALLETYKMEHSGICVKKDEDINVSNFLKEIIKQISSIFVLHNKKIDYLTAENDNYSANFDTFLVKRVVNNLILNALQYSGKSDRVEIYTKKEDETFEISIKDFGSGINKEEIDKIFNKFYSGKTSTIKTSTGLGLYLSNRIIKAHGGEIKVISEKGKGTEFTVILPLK